MARQSNQRNRQGAPMDSSETTNRKSARPLEDRIRERAYERYQERGGEHGRDTDDWFEAEREMRGENEHGTRDK